MKLGPHKAENPCSVLCEPTGPFKQEIGCPAVGNCAHFLPQCVGVPLMYRGG